MFHLDLTAPTGYRASRTLLRSSFHSLIPSYIRLPRSPALHVTLLRALRPDVGGWVTLSPRYWAGKPSVTDGGRAPYAAVLSCDPSWSSKLARCLTQQCKRKCAKAKTSQRRVFQIVSYPAP